MSRGLRTILHSERWKSEDFASWPSMLTSDAKSTNILRRSCFAHPPLRPPKNHATQRR
ncbi:MAG: hypothetical protein ACTS4T_01750 [Candidatus Hodgkinia cicadicola]